MAWLRGKVALGSFPDLAGAVNKISESVKNIEKNFDNALGFEDQQRQPPAVAASASTLDDDASQSSSASESGRQRDGSGKESVSEKLEYSKKLESIEKHDSVEKHGESSGKRDDSLKKHKYSDKHDQYSSGKHESSGKFETSKQKEGADDSTKEHFPQNNETCVENLKPEEHQDHLVDKNNAISEEADTRAEKCGDINTVIGDQGVKSAVKSIDTNTATSHETTAIVDNHIEAKANLEAKPNANILEESEFLIAQHKRNPKINCVNNSTSIEEESENIVGQVPTTAPELNEVHTVPHPQKSDHELNIQEKAAVGVEASYDGRDTIESEPQGLQSYKAEVSVSVEESQPPLLKSSDDASEMLPNLVLKHENVKDHYVNQLAGDDQTDQAKGQNASSGSNLSDKADSAIELERLKKEMKNMEAALLGAARQAQAKVDEIAKLVNENEQLKSIIVDQKRKSNEAEIEGLRAEYHKKISTLERKVYTLTRERDTLRKEQNKRSDAAALLKEKDEIITQVMAEGEALSKKQAIQESTIRKLRAQVREFEDEKKGLKSKIQIEENKVESLKRDKVTTEKLMQETREKNQAELATQKDYYMKALSAAKEEKALAKAQANDEARTEQESHLRETKERETMLLQTLEELRQTLSIKELQSFFKEDMLRKDMDDLQKRYQASERRCEELVMQVPESTRPLLRQIETMQETTARKAEAWAAVERSLNVRLQDAEAKAEAAEERDHSVNDRLSKTLSRVHVLEAQISCLRAEQTQLTKSLEKERQRASENRQEYLALKEEADTNKGHANQLKEEMMELRRKHKWELQEVLTQRELLQQDIERERSARLELEKATRFQVSTVSGQNSIAKTRSVSENGLTRRLPSPRSLSSMEESSFLQASLDSSHTFSARIPREPAINSYYLKSMTPSAFQSALRQKEGELASYMTRLASLESIRDSLSEGLVKMTKERDKLRSEVALLPSMKAELETLRLRHSAALELMGEQDEELEELRADNVDLKEMYREQINLLVNKIEKG